MDTSIVKLPKLPFHSYSLFPSARYTVKACDICGVIGGIYGGYFCTDPNAWFHKECLELPLKINHPFHPQHPLLLVYKKIYFGNCCDSCGEGLVPYHYSCSTCEFKVDLNCGTEPSPPVIEHPVCHDHPLVLLKKQFEEGAHCEVCKGYVARHFYSCRECDVHFHLNCVHISKEVIHPCHPSHSLKLTEYESRNLRKKCFACGQTPIFIYYCSLCNFSSCLYCIKSPPPLAIENPKTHKHPLTFLVKRVLCTCNICGVKDIAFHYICLQCGFVVHVDCIDLPQVININRHDHRISFTHHLGLEYMKCGVCRKRVSQYTGAYSCLVCPDYAVHTSCATRFSVWDGVELEGKPETNEEDIAPFKVVGDGLIRHFSHDKHTLRLHKTNIIHDESARCEACCHPVGLDPIYSCEDCYFILHKRCADLPKQKRLVFHSSPFLLLGPGDDGKGLECQLCEIYFTGFEYKSQGGSQDHIDLQCSSLSEPFIHGAHSHPLYFDQKWQGPICAGCPRYVQKFALSCDGCKFRLCLGCASLPLKIKHNNDEHPLSLCFGEKPNGNYWCDICERRLDPSKWWFYTCFDCGGTFHVQCVLGDFSRLMPGRIIDIEGIKVEAILNNRNTRPICTCCSHRCQFSVILKAATYNNSVYYFCSRSCLTWFTIYFEKFKLGVYPLYIED